MKRIRAAALTLAFGTLAVFAVGTRTLAQAVDTVVQNVFVTNTAANPVPVAGTVNVGNFPSKAPREATQSFSIPLQGLAAGTAYTFTGVFTTASLLSIVTHDPIEVTFNGPAPVLVATKSPKIVPLTERIQVDTVTVACKAASGHCYFRFFVVGDY